MVKVYEYIGDTEIIADVEYNNNLDIWNGQNWQSGGTGQHKGLTRLEDGRFVLIHGSDWQGVQDYGVIITESEALNEIIESGNLDLLDEFGLRDQYEESMVKEKDWNTKSVKVSREVHKILTDLKSGNDTYDDVIMRLLKNKYYEIIEK